MKKVIIVLIGLILVTGCGNKMGDYHEISFSEYEKMVEKSENFILYLGYPECSFCQEFSPKLKKAIEKYKLDVKYLDVSKLENEQRIKIDNDTYSKGTPTVIFAKEGKIKLFPRIEGNVSEEEIYEKLKAAGYIE